MNNEPNGKSRLKPKRVAEVVREHGGYLVRVLNCLSEFHEKFGRWPDELRLSYGAHKVLLEHHLTPLGYALLTERLCIIVSENDDGPLTAHAFSGEQFDYGQEGWSGNASQNADLWLWKIEIHGPQ